MGLKKFRNPSSKRPNFAKIRGENGKVCKECGFRIRGKNHESGSHHSKKRPHVTV